MQTKLKEEDERLGKEEAALDIQTAL